jgi:adenylate cyclase
MWAEALALFRQALALRPQDGPSRAMAQRCLEYEAHPPEPWDGVFDQLVK